MTSITLPEGVRPETLAAHEATRKQLLSMFNPQANRAEVAGRTEKTTKVDSKIAQIIAQLAGQNSAHIGSGILANRDVTVVGTQPVRRDSSGSIEAGKRAHTETTPLIAPKEKEQELTCCQKAMKAVFCCFSS